MARISDVSDVVESVLPSLAFIRTPDGMGSGWAYQDDLFVSNQHVVGNATEVELRCGGKMRTAPRRWRELRRLRAGMATRL